jgi:hypothetical protein
MCLCLGPCSSSSSCLRVRCSSAMTLASDVLRRVVAAVPAVRLCCGERLVGPGVSPLRMAELSRCASSHRGTGVSTLVSMYLQPGARQPDAGSSCSSWSRAVGKWSEARAVVNAKRCPRQASRFGRQLEPSTCPQPPRLGGFRGRCAKPVDPRNLKFVRQHSVNAPACLVHPCSPNSCQS